MRRVAEEPWGHEEPWEEPWGHPYRVLVKYKNTLPGPKFFRLCESGLRPGWVCLLLHDPHLTNRSGRPALLGHLRVLWDSFVESAGRPAALSRSHPSGSRPDAPGLETQEPSPLPTSSGPEQRQYRTPFTWRPSGWKDSTDLISRLT